MIKVKVVTGYVPIPLHPRGPQEYGALGEKLGELAPIPIHPFYNTVADCWLQRYVKRHTLVPGWAEGDNPAKNSLLYHIVQHQKFEWLVHAAAQDKTPDTLVWIDYGIHHVPGVTTDVIADFLAAIQKDDLAIPGCWSADDARALNASEYSPNWRFCGGVLVVPRQFVWPLFVAVRRQVQTHLRLTNRLTWEVNTLATVERGSQLPIRWYQADHNERLFTAYRKNDGCAVPGVGDASIPASSDR